MPRTSLSLSIPDTAWVRHNDDAPDSDGRLLAHLVVRIGGHSVDLHLEAIPVHVSASGLQEGIDETSDAHLDAIAGWHGCAFETVPITRDGVTRDYVLVASPYGT